MEEEIKMTFEDWEKFYESQGSKFFQLEGEILGEHGENRNPFGYDRFSDSDNETFKPLGSRNVLKVNPTGLLMVVGLKPYNLTADSIVNISVSSDLDIPLSPALGGDGQVYPVSDWVIGPKP